MAVSYSPSKGPKVETRQSSSSDGQPRHGTGDVGATKHVRVDSKTSNSGLSPSKSKKKPEPRFTPLPVGASPRVLCLDGGGIRGIVQLETLRGIEHALGNHIPAPAFFDLIVGTGTGGLIAMTLSMRGQTVNTCTDQFKTICDRAFKPKIKAAAPLVRSISAKLGSGRPYRSKSLYTVLQATFGESNALLESPTYFTQGSRVAVTSSHAIDQEPFLLANYLRPETLDLQHTEQDHSLKVWQSVAAAIADPAYFPPFEHDMQTYLDGGLKCGNPVLIADKERRLLWPEASTPDLFLSLGTGQHRPRILHDGGSPDREEKFSSPTKPTKQTARMSRRWSMRKEDECLDSERAWATFKANLIGNGPNARGRQYVRLNPDLGRSPPAPDNKDEIEALQDSVREGMQRPQKAASLRNIAHRLVASSFYLDSRSTVTGEMGERVFSGTLACRFKYGSSQLRALGRILSDRSVRGFEPYILVKPDAHSKYQASTIKFTKEIVRVMIERGIFALPAVTIPLHDEATETTLNLFLDASDETEPDGFPISGFPDVLDNQLTRQQSSQKMTPRSRQRAFSDQHHLSSGQVPTVGFLSRAKSTSGVPYRFAQNKRATYSHPIMKATSPHVSLQSVIAEEQESGAHVERSAEATKQVHSYLGDKPVAQNPDLYSTEEIARFSSLNGSGRLRGNNHLRSSSVATDLDAELAAGGLVDHMWSPLEGGRSPHLSIGGLLGDTNPP